MLAPVSNFGAFSTAIEPGDPKLLAWTFAWTSHAILTGAPLFDANIFYPARSALTFAEHHIGVGIWGLPLYALTGNAVLVFSVLRIAALALNGVSMHFFAWRWLRSHAAALIAGLVFSVSSSRLIYTGHLPLVWNCWLPLILISLERWASRREWRWLLASSVLVALQALATWYLAVMAALAVVVFGLWYPLWLRLSSRGGDATVGASLPETHRRRRLLLTLSQGAAGGLLILVIVWPFAQPYFALSGREETPARIVLRYAADWGSYVQPPEGALAGPFMKRVLGLSTRRVGAERAQFLGLVTIALAAIAALRCVWLVARRRGRSGHAAHVLWGGYLLILGLVAIAFSLGPSNGGRLLMPFDLISKTPALGMFRVPSRFAVLVTLAFAGLAAWGFAELQRLGRRTGVLIGMALVPVMLLEWAITPPVSSKPAPDVTPPIYYLIPTLDVHALVSLPCYRLSTTPWLDADYMLYSTVHWRPIVNGYGRAQPPGDHWVVGAVEAFPGPGSAARMRSLGIDYVVLHADRYPDRAAAILAEAHTSGDFAQVARIGNDYLFRLLPKP
jgi:hypothetical protein